MTATTHEEYQLASREHGVDQNMVKAAAEVENLGSASEVGAFLSKEGVTGLLQAHDFTGLFALLGQEGEFWIRKIDAAFSHYANGGALRPASPDPMPDPPPAGPEPEPPPVEPPAEPPVEPPVEPPAPEGA
jgi:hypothetical protein